MTTTLIHIRDDSDVELAHLLSDAGHRLAVAGPDLTLLFACGRPGHRSPAAVILGDLEDREDRTRMCTVAEEVLGRLDVVVGETDRLDDVRVATPAPLAAVA